MPRRLRWCLNLMFACLAAWSAAGPAQAGEIWLGPAPFSADYQDLFRSPDKWAAARGATKVFIMGPQAVGGVNEPGINTIKDLQGVDAFGQLKRWGIALSLDVPAVKPWDCTGERALAATLKFIASARAAGNGPKYVRMDEPLAGGVLFCKDTPRGSAEKTARYIRALAAKEPDVVIGDIEAYPYFDMPRLKEWIETLAEFGAKPALFHVDVNIHRIDVDRRFDPAADLRALRDFVRARGMKFGVILWSGYNPSPTDRDYYQRTMSWAKRVHEAIGTPDDIVVQSWVIRSSPRCTDTDPACIPPKLRCGPGDPPGCGLQAVPNNLPEKGADVFTQTRLVNDARRLFGGR